MADTKAPSAPPTLATVCQLENHPENYDRKLVEVSGRIYFFNGCLAIAAKHWGEAIKPTGGLANPRGWISPDMTVYYGFSGGFIQKPGQTMEMTPSSSFTRQVCRAGSPPYSASDHVSCSFYRSFRPEDKNAVIAIQEKVDAGQETWRVSDMAQVAWLAYDNQRKQWNLDAATEARLSKCDPSPPGKDDKCKQQQWGYCTWLTPDDMQEITVQLHKPGYLDKHGGELKGVVWVPQTVEVNFCQAKPSPH